MLSKPSEWRTFNKCVDYKSTFFFLIDFIAYFVSYRFIKSKIKISNLQLVHFYNSLQVLRVFIFSPQLTWRDVQHLTVLTSKRNSLFDAKDRFHWTMNGVGLEFNHLFGYGVLDAGAMVALAKKWKTVPARYHCEAGSIREMQ